MKEKGITLIALVITIIVLLILATVSVVTLTGENGIISKAREAKEQTEKANIKEQVLLAILGSYDSYGKIDYEALKNNLNYIEETTGVPDPIIDSSFPLKITVKGYEVTVQKNGTVTVGDESSSGGDESGGDTPGGETPEVYTITYNENGGDEDSIPTDQTVTKGQTLQLSATVPTRAGYDFKGWWTDDTSTDTDSLYQPGQSYSFTGNETLYAIWEIKTLSFTSGGKEIEAEKGGSNELRIYLPTSCRVEYTIFHSIGRDSRAGYNVSGSGGNSTSDEYTAGNGEITDFIEVNSGDFVAYIFTSGTQSSITFTIDRIVNLDTNEEYKIAGI